MRVGSDWSRRGVLAGGAMLAAGGAAAAEPGLILHGGPIHTGLPGKTPAEAVVIQGDRIAFVGALAEAKSRAPGAKRIDLHGAAAFPGFVDSHCHLTELGLLTFTLNLNGTASVADLKQRLAAYASANPTGPIAGAGWIETHWPEGRFPTREDLDAVVADRPVMLSRSDGHALVANSKMLELAGITASTADPAGGRIYRDKAGRPTGMVIDNAMGLVERRLPPPTIAVKAEALEAALKLYASRGWTGAHFMSANNDDLLILRRLASQNRAPIRVDLYLDVNQAGDVLAHGPRGDAEGRIRARGVKIYMDGALGSRGAALLEPYSDAPDTRGLLRSQHDTTMPILKQALASGAQVATHAIGDRGNRLILDWYQEAFGGHALKPSPRWRVEHAQIVSDQDLPRFARLGVIASMQPSHAIGDLYFAPKRLGEARLKEGYAWRSFLKSGAVVTGGTDAPVEKGDPLVEFYAAAYRHALNGFAGPDWHLEEGVTRQQALHMFTAAPAYAGFREKEMGLIAPGRLADISVFSTDLMRAPFAEIPKAHAVMTISAGRVVHQA
jgi:predicted amidohydrolase YtcJ